jgi:hypothetical protein
MVPVAAGVDVEVVVVAAVSVDGPDVVDDEAVVLGAPVEATIGATVVVAGSAVTGIVVVAAPVVVGPSVTFVIGAAVVGTLVDDVVGTSTVVVTAVVGAIVVVGASVVVVVVVVGTAVVVGAAVVVVVVVVNVVGGVAVDVVVLNITSFPRQRCNATGHVIVPEYPAGAATVPALPSNGQSVQAVSS